MTTLEPEPLGVEDTQEHDPVVVPDLNNTPHEDHQTTAIRGPNGMLKDIFVFSRIFQ